MSFEYVGFAIRYPGEVSFDDGVILPVPYGDSKYNVAITNQELDMLAINKVVKNLAKTAFPGFSDGPFDSRVALNGGDLPLYLGVRDVADNESGLRMNLSVVTQSQVYEHRGTADLRRIHAFSDWRLESYMPHPPLRYPEDPEHVGWHN